MQIIRTKNPEQVAADTLSELLAHYHTGPVLLLVSAGSALALLDNVSPSVFGNRLTVGVLDERYDESDTINNFSQLQETRFFKAVVAAGGSYIDTKMVPGDAITTFVRRFDEAISAWQNSHTDGVILATFGLGPDGHTAGIMPGYVALIESVKTAVVGYEVPLSINPYPKRATITPYFLTKHISAAVAFVDNQAKCAVLEQVLSGSGEVETIPALLWHKVKNLTVVTSCTE